MTFLEKTVVQELKNIISKIEQGKCEMTEQNAIDVISCIAHISVSKDQACEYLNVQKTRFGQLVQQGEIPKGRKERGWKELKWYKDELIKALHNIKRKHKQTLNT